MRRCRLFCPTLCEGSLLLSPEESHHAIAALRAKPGQEVLLFDGRGREAIGRITAIERRLLCVDVRRATRRPFELSCKITLAVAMARHYRQGYLIEKCTELGVAAIWPVIAERSVGNRPATSKSRGDPRRPKPAARGKRGVQAARWYRRAIEAAKQSGRAWVPEIAAPQTFAESVDRVGEFDGSSLTHTDSKLTPFSRFLAAQPAGGSVLVWVGPEGGWADGERDRALNAGAVLTTLGPTALRTETAAVAVCAAAALHSTMRHFDSRID